MNILSTKRRVATWGLLGIFGGMFLSFATSLTAQESERKLVKRVEPEYPEVLKSKGIGGTVRLRVIVRSDGTVKDVVVVGGNSILVDAASKAVKQWRYVPMDRDAMVDITVQFDPHPDPTKNHS